MVTMSGPAVPVEESRFVRCPVFLALYFSGAPLATHIRSFQSQNSIILEALKRHTDMTKGGVAHSETKSWLSERSQKLTEQKDAAHKDAQCNPAETLQQA